MSLGKHLSKRLADGHVIPVLGFGTSAPPKRVEGMKPAVRITAASLPVVTFSCDFRRPAVPVRCMRGTRRDVSVARGPGERET